MWVFGVKTGFGRLNCRVWASQARKKRSKTFENVQKYSKTFKNIQILSTNVRKYSKIFEKLGETFENIRQFRSSAAGALAGRSQETEVRIWFDGLENFGFAKWRRSVRAKARRSVRQGRKFSYR